MSHAKPKVLFVAGLTPVKSGGTGGVVTAACLLRDSELGTHLNWLELSDTVVSLPPPPVWRRAFTAAARLRIFVQVIPRVDAVIIYCGGGTSLVEKSLMCAIANALGKGVVLQINSGAILEDVRRHSWVRGALRVAMRSAHTFAAQGSFWTEWFGAWGRPEQMMSIPNGVELPDTVAEPKAPFTVAFLSRMEANKGPFELMDAAETLCARHPTLRFLLMGGGTVFPEMEQLVKDSPFADRIELTGWVKRDDGLNRLRSCSAFVLPTYWEGLPNSVLEAMALGLPIVTTPVGAIPDAVFDGDNGYLVPPQDTEALTEALDRLISNPERAAEMGARSRQIMQEQFTVDTMWPRYAEALARACRQAGRSDAAAHFDAVAQQSRH